MRFAFFSTKNRKYRHVFEIKSVFFFKEERKGKKDNSEGALGVEPRTSRSAVECSTTELYPRCLDEKVTVKYLYHKT